MEIQRRINAPTVPDRNQHGLTCATHRNVTEDEERMSGGSGGPDALHSSAPRPGIALVLLDWSRARRGTQQKIVYNIVTLSSNLLYMIQVLNTRSSLYGHQTMGCYGVARLY